MERLPQFPCRQFSSASSSDTGPSLDGSIESGALSDLQSDEDEGRRSADHYLQLTAPPLGRQGSASLALQLLEDVQSRDKDPDVWKRIEVGSVGLLSVCYFTSTHGFAGCLSVPLHERPFFGWRSGDPRRSSIMSTFGALHM